MQSEAEIQITAEEVSRFQYLFQARSQEFFVGGATVGPLMIFQTLLNFSRGGGVVDAISKFGGGVGFEVFRLSLSWMGW